MRVQGVFRGLGVLPEHTIGCCVYILSVKVFLVHS